MLGASHSDRIGPLQPGFRFDLGSGYQALVGGNNAGKSAILQLVFRQAVAHGEFGLDRTCLILPDRHFLSGTNEAGGSRLSTYNTQLFNLSNPILSYEDPQQRSGSGLNAHELPKILLSHDNMYRQLGRCNELLEALDLPPFVLGEGQRLNFEDVAGVVQGTGLRSVFAILAAMTDQRLRVLLIDEPEISLEPRLQRRLRDLLIEYALESERAVLVATHSHLFLAPRLEQNSVVERRGEEVFVRPLESEHDKLDLVFRLLGNSPDDLFLPTNYVVVEGASDQVLVEAAMRIVDPAAAEKVKVLAANGITNVAGAIAAVSQVLRPLVVADSPYSARVVAMVDAPRAEHVKQVDQIRQVLGPRLIELEQPSLEEYAPSSLYTAAGLTKEAALDGFSKAGTEAERRLKKREISTALARALTEEFLSEMPALKEAAERAFGT